MKPSLKHRAWLIDLDGTLYRPTLVKLMMLAELGIGGVFAAVTLRHFRHFHEKLREELAADLSLEFDPSPYEEQILRTASHTGKSSEQIRELTEEWMLRRPGKWLKAARRKELILEIESFKNAGGRTALVSDYPATQKLAALGVQHLFDTIVANGETVGLRRLKPSADGYLLAARTLGVEPNECLVIGDRDDADGAAARAAQMEFRHIV